MDVWIGTSGYSYPDWVGGFYPAGMRTGGMFAYYCQQFPLVELNFTFYRLPTATMLARLSAQAPTGFQFIVKLPRTLTHERVESDITAFRDAVRVLREQGRLLSLLCQLPQSFHFGIAQRAWLETLADAYRGFPMAVEFRHRSWQGAGTDDWLRRHTLDLVSVDVPSLPNLYPGGLVFSGSIIYVRFHSRNAAKWYATDKDRYDYDYSDAELGQWITALDRQKENADRAFILFNNCQRGHAAVNANRMRELLRQYSPESKVIEPFQSNAQPTLFD
jgi:uncharacterized protein YecE (DUF72 family)